MLNWYTRLGTAFLLFLGALLLRLITRTPYPDSWDAASFALAVERFDMYYMQPHFPGYPLYILPAKLLYAWGVDSLASLVWVSAVSGAISTLAIYLVAYRWFGKEEALWIGLLAVVNPLLWLTSEQPMSESVGVMAIWFALWVLATTKVNNAPLQKGMLCAFILGLTMGVRLSYFPFVALLFAPWWLSSSRKTLSEKVKNAACLGLAFGLGVLAWLAPVAAAEGGFSSYLQMGIFFVEGHFTDWGGSVLTSAAPLSRINDFFTLVLVSLGGGGVVYGPGTVLRWGVDLLLLMLGLATVLTGKAEAAKRFRHLRGGQSSLGRHKRGPVAADPTSSGEQRHPFSIGDLFLFRRFGTMKCDRGMKNILFVEGVKRRFRILSKGASLSSWGYQKDDDAGLNPGDAKCSQLDRVRSTRETNSPVWLWFLGVVPYSLWIVWGQNLDKPRHVVVLIPFLLMAVVKGVQLTEQLFRPAARKWWRRSFLGGLLFLTGVGVAWPTIHEYATVAPPVVQLGAFIDQHYSPGNTTIYTWEEARVIKYLYPAYHTQRLRREEDFVNQVLVAGPEVKTLVSNAVLGGFGERAEVYLPYMRQVFAVSSDPFLYPVYHTIVLYEAKPSFYLALQQGLLIRNE